MGAALCACKPVDLDKVIKQISVYRGSGNFAFNKPLFKNRKELDEFRKRHAKATVRRGELKDHHGKVFIGIDAGSTTVKGVVTAKDGTLLYSEYLPNSGNPVPIVKSFLEHIYEINPTSKSQALLSQATAKRSSKTPLAQISALSRLSLT